MIVWTNSAVKMDFIIKTIHNVSEKGVTSHRVNLMKLYSFIFQHLLQMLIRDVMVISFERH